MPLNIKNLDALRNFKPEEYPQMGEHLYQALRTVSDASNLTEQQTNSSVNAQRPTSPPDINAVNVTGQNGHFNIAITDNNQNLYAGIKYYAEHSSTANFSDPHVIDMGSSRNHNVYLGNVRRYWRAYSAYPSSPSSSPAYHGGVVQPKVVIGGGENGGPSFLASQGSGTGLPGQGLSGPGPIAYRSTNGKPPVRVPSK